MIHGEHQLSAGAFGVMFTAESVQQIGANQKTQTRRLLTSGNTTVDGSHWSAHAFKQLRFDDAWIDRGPSPAGNRGPYLKAPYIDPELNTDNWKEYGTVHRVYPGYQIGDRWYVKEAYGIGGALLVDPCLNYRADGAQMPVDPKWIAELMERRDTDSLRLFKEGWKSPLLMPRWAARHFLEITSVRIERLQSITAADAWLEGCRPADVPRHAGDGTRDVHEPTEIVIEAYAKRWDQINAVRGHGWLTNPWVVVYDFVRLKKKPQ